MILAGCGSSPRLWGTPADHVWLFEVIRFIPTPVGNTSAYNIVFLASCGSSPRLWGTQFFFVYDKRTSRFIPTPVGNTVYWHVTITVLSVHPHACGEHVLI